MGNLLAPSAHDRLKTLRVQVKQPARQRQICSSVSQLLFKDDLKQKQGGALRRRPLVQHSLPRRILVIGGEYSNQTQVLIKPRTSLSSGNAAVNVVCRGEHKSLIRNAMRAIGEFNETSASIFNVASAYLNSGSRADQMGAAG